MRRHHLAPTARARSALAVAEDLVALHGTDPSSVFLAVAARTEGVSAADLERALYEERRLVRMLGMRRTMFVVPAELVGVVHAACTIDIARRERARLIQHLEGAGIATDGAAWLAQAEAQALEVLERRGEALGAEVTAEAPLLGARIRHDEGTAYEGVQGVSTRVLFLLAADGLVARGRPRGAWTSSQYRWAPLDRWLPGGVAEVGADAARAELARRWLATFGPGTADDLKWWTGWTMTVTRRTLSAVGAVAVAVALEGESAPGFVLGDDADPVAPVEPGAALLPALDPTAMGWAGRAWYLGPHAARLFDRSGNIGPTIWWDGRIVGGWAQRKSGEIATALLEDAGAAATEAIGAEAGRLQEWLGPVRVTPRFRTPLERELVLA